MLAVGATQFTGCKKGEEDPGLSFRSRKGRLAGDWTVNSFTMETSSESEYDDDPNISDEVIAREGSSTMTFDGSTISETSMDTWTYDGDGFTREEEEEYSASGSSYEGSYKVVYTDGTTETTKYDGDYSSTASWTYTFEKDGTFTASSSMTQSMTSEFVDPGVYRKETTETETNTQTISGTWAFIGGNDEDEFKNKERINLWYKDYSETSVSESDVDYTDLDDEDWYDYSDDDYTSESESVSTDVMSGTDPDETWELVMLKNKEMEVNREYSGTYSSTYENSYTSGNTTTSSESEYTSTVTQTSSMSLSQD